MRRGAGAGVIRLHTAGCHSVSPHGVRGPIRELRLRFEDDPVCRGEPTFVLLIDALKPAISSSNRNSARVSACRCEGGAGLVVSPRSAA